MARGRCAQSDARQQCLDFGAHTESAEQSQPSLRALSIETQQRLNRTLRLLGSNATAADADVDAARMQAHVSCTMARRRTAVNVDRDLEYGLAVLMLCLNQALKEGSLCVGAEQFRHQNEVFDEVMARRAFYEDDSSRYETSQWDFERLVKRLLAEGFVCRTDQTLAQGAFADGPSLLVAETAQGETFVYTHKSYEQEETLGVHLAQLARNTVAQSPVAPEAEASRAGKLALENQFTVISGGPGTGKTTAVVSILQGLIERNADARILLAAPTGKAASRMKEAIADGVRKIADPLVRDRLLGIEAKTLHRTLYTPGADGRAASKYNPLDADIVVVDESSMIDIGLAGDFFERIDSSRTKVILLGDRHQLAAVGPGSFFADVSQQDGPLKDNISHLTKSWRFDGTKALGALAQAARQGDAKTVLSVLKRSRNNDCAFDNPLRLHEELPEGELTKTFKAWLRQELDRPLREVSELMRSDGLRRQTDARKLSERLAKLYFSIGVLAANRQGPMSAQAVNDYAEELFLERRIPFPAFRPMIVRRNDPMLEVYNGDTGVVIPGQEWFDGQVFDATRADVYFPDTQRCVRFGLIGHIDPAFAITIHQSQGSEYHHVAVLMPTNSASGLNSRELFYTAVTRVRDQRSEQGVDYGSLDVFGSEEIVQKAVATAMRRQGGLTRRIREAQKVLESEKTNQARGI